MGNSSTKEDRHDCSSSVDHHHHHGHRGQQSGQTAEHVWDTTQSSQGHGRSRRRDEESTRHSDPRQQRIDLLTSLGISTGSSRGEFASAESARRETRPEREARKLEKERINRLKERERSMRSEHVDGGYLVTQGVYTGIEDFNKPIVRSLMIDRRIAPFWRGLNEHQDAWTENQLVAAAKGLPIPPADEVPVTSSLSGESVDEATDMTMTPSIDKMIGEESHRPALPMVSSDSPPLTSDTSAISQPHDTGNSTKRQSPEGNNSPTSIAQPLTSTISSAFIKGRTKTFAPHIPGTSTTGQTDFQSREIMLPHAPLISGQRLGAYLYKDVEECSICYLYYPPYLNKTRCCDQPICSECFVQIKRPDPHRPEHAESGNTAPNPTPATSSDPPAVSSSTTEAEFISEPAACPFCRVPEFGITYDPPAFRRGLVYAQHVKNHDLQDISSSRSTESTYVTSSSAEPSMSTGGSGGSVGRLSSPASRRRAISVSADSAAVTTTDQVRPDWEAKLASARSHYARRSAAATALHTAAYVIGNHSTIAGEGDNRSFSTFGRRGLLRRTSGGEMASVISSLTQQTSANDRSNSQAGQAGHTESENHSSSRRLHTEDIEEMMMLEAIRLSLASEEERKRREEKEARKEAKRQDKEQKKLDRSARKSGLLFPGDPSRSESSSTAAAGSQDPSRSSGISGPSVADADHTSSLASSNTTLTSPFASSKSTSTSQQTPDSPLQYQHIANKPEPFPHSHFHSESGKSQGQKGQTMHQEQSENASSGNADVEA